MTSTTTIYDWTKNFDYNKIEWLQYDDPSLYHLNHLLIICHRREKQEEKITAEFRQKWNKVKFTFMRIKNITDAFTAYDNVLFKKEYSNIIFSDCDNAKCRFCKNGKQFKKQLRKHFLIRSKGRHYFRFQKR